MPMRVVRAGLRHRRGVLLAAALILFFSAVTGWQITQNAQERNREIEQLCEAVPAAATASAQALVNTLVAENNRRGRPSAENERLLFLGRLWEIEARRLTLREIPECASYGITP